MVDGNGSDKVSTREFYNELIKVKDEQAITNRNLEKVIGQNNIILEKLETHDNRLNEVENEQKEIKKKQSEIERKDNRFVAIVAAVASILSSSITGYITWLIANK